MGLGNFRGAHREWIQAEIEIAQYYEKPIIGVIPRGQERLPSVVMEAAWEAVRRNTDSIVAAIRKYSI